MYRELTVASLRGADEDEHVEVLFLESARIYLLARARPDFGGLLERLRQAEATGRAVRISLASADSDLIEDVEGSWTPETGESDE